VSIAASLKEQCIFRAEKGPRGISSEETADPEILKEFPAKKKRRQGAETGKRRAAIPFGYLSVCAPYDSGIPLPSERVSCQR